MQVSAACPHTHLLASMPLIHGLLTHLVVSIARRKGISGNMVTKSLKNASSCNPSHCTRRNARITFPHTNSSAGVENVDKMRLLSRSTAHIMLHSLASAAANKTNVRMNSDHASGHRSASRKRSINSARRAPSNITIMSENSHTSIMATVRCALLQPCAAEMYESSAFVTTVCAADPGVLFRFLPSKQHVLATDEQHARHVLLALSLFRLAGISSGQNLSHHARSEKWG